MTEGPIGISVVIPAFGRADALRRAVGSVRATDPRNVEIVIVDDGSAEPLRAVGEPVSGNGISVRLYRATRNAGAGVARNLGVRRSRYPYIAFLDSDDVFLPDKIDALRSTLSATDADLVIHPVEGAPRYNAIMRFWAQRLRGVVPFDWLVSVLNPVPTCALTIRRTGRLGHPTLRHAEDWAFLLRNVTATTRVAYIPRVLTAIDRPIGSAGGLSHARSAMRDGEFVARRLLLKEPSARNIARYALGSAAGSARRLADRLRTLRAR